MKQLFASLIIASVIATTAVPAHAGALHCFAHNVVNNITTAGRNIAGNVTTFWPSYALAGAATVGLAGYAFHKTHAKNATASAATWSKNALRGAFCIGILALVRAALSPSYKYHVCDFDHTPHNTFLARAKSFLS